MGKNTDTGKNASVPRHKETGGRSGKAGRSARPSADLIRSLIREEREFVRLFKKAVSILMSRGIEGVINQYRLRRIRLSAGKPAEDVAGNQMSGNNSFADNVGVLHEPQIPQGWIDIQRKKPLISIVIAAKGLKERAFYLERVLESLASQRYRNLEAVLAADPEDAAYVREIAQAFEGRLELALVLLDAAEKDQWIYWKEGVAASRGSLIGFLNQEETLTPNCLVYVLEAYNESSVRKWELYLIPDAVRTKDGGMILRDWKQGAGRQTGGAEGLLHFGVFEKSSFKNDRTSFEKWLLSLSRERIFIAPWTGCLGTAEKDLWDNRKPRCLAFYLPQFHEIPENNKWWGKGFTEWVNVRRAEPLYASHHQPRIPGELGYYDLGGEEGRELQKRQIALAKEYGITGFCYYCYWFDDGRRLLQMPLDRHLGDKEMDFPFCICWANENWTRQWDGQKNQVLMPQTYKKGWAEKFLLDMFPYLKDDRYICVNGAPYLLIYNLQDIPDPAGTIDIWRALAEKNGIKKLHISAVRRTIDASEMALSGHKLDSLTDFPPHLLGLIDIDHDESEKFSSGLAHGQLKDYRKACRYHAGMPVQDYTYFRTVMLEWDNTPRRGKDAYIFEEFSFEDYRAWLYAAKRYVIRQNGPGEDLLFINAWNEWAEGTYLEPSDPLGRAALESTREVLEMR